MTAREMLALYKSITVINAPHIKASNICRVDQTAHVYITDLMMDNDVNYYGDNVAIRVWLDLNLYDADDCGGAAAIARMLVERYGMTGFDYVWIEVDI